VSCSIVQRSPSSGQVAGQEAAGSHVSPAPTWPSPQIGAQSASVAGVHPGGQQPSPARQAVIGAWPQAREQPATDPEAKSSVQAFPSSQEGGHQPGMPAVMARSQRSPGSTTPSPQTAGQSLSSAASQPGGQQPSPGAHAPIGRVTQRALHAAAVPSSSTTVQAPSDGQAVGQLAPGVVPSSQLSLGPSTTPFPHAGAQSGSTANVAPGGQQPSPASGAVMGTNTQAASQVPAPTRMSRVQLFPSLHDVGQAPAAPAAMPVSHVSCAAV
jgi:hypothetical protein